MAVIISLIAVYIKLRVLLEQLRHRRVEITIEEKSKSTKCKHKLLKIRRTLKLVYASLIVGAAEVHKSGH